MKLRVLVDNNTLIDRYFYAEPGVSYLIEDQGCRVLFDVGYSDIFIKNANKMGINLRNLDYIVLSHGHLDHTWGLDPLIKLHTEDKIEGLESNDLELITHPHTFNSKRVGNLEEIGAIIDKKKVGRIFNLRLSKNPVWLTDRLVFLGEIERGNAFEAGQSIGEIVEDGNNVADYLLEDSALAYKSSNGLVIITACSHAGICNIIDYAMKVCDEERVVDIIGGFHLLHPSKEELRETINYLKELNLKELHACHCTSLKAKLALGEVLPLKEVGVGLTLDYS